MGNYDNSNISMFHSSNILNIEVKGSGLSRQWQASCDACLIPDALVRTFVTHLENIGSWLYNGDAQNSKKSFHVAFMGQKDGAGPELESSGTAPFVYLQICTIVYIFNLYRL